MLGRGAVSLCDCNAFASTRPALLAALAKVLPRLLEIFGKADETTRKEDSEGVDTSAEITFRVDRLKTQSMFKRSC